jgi:ribosomal protein L21E
MEGRPEPRFEGVFGTVLNVDSRGYAAVRLDEPHDGETTPLLRIDRLRHA